jgi:hypothetical protein
MPQLETIYAPALYRTPEDLRDWMIRARAYGFVTLSQGKALVGKLTPMLPVTASLALRTPKSMIYVTANGAQLRINQRAQVDDKGWNPNPRKPARNPWAD